MRGGPLRRAVLAFVTGATLASCNAVPSATPAPPLDASAPSALLPADACVELDWVRLPGAPDRRSLLRVPVTVGGETLGFQLDTGADATFLYADSAEVARERPVERRGRSLWTHADLAVGRHRVADAEIVVAGRRRRGAARVATRVLALPHLDGTLGLDALAGTVALLDYPAQRLCLLDAVPGALDARTDWAPATLRGHRLRLRAHVGDHVLDSLLFDTGSSALAVTVDRAPWERLTGTTAEGGGVEHRTVSAWGRAVPLAGAPALGDLRLGAARIARPMVWTRTEAPTYHADELTDIGGIVGNVPFWDGAVVLDLRDGAARFGIVREGSGEAERGRSR